MIDRAKGEDIPRILELLVQVNMVHHNGRPDLFKGPTTKYNADELKTLLADDQRPVFVYRDESGRVLGYAFCILKEVRGERTAAAGAWEAPCTATCWTTPGRSAAITSL